MPSLDSVADQEDAQIERSAVLAIMRSLVPRVQGVFRARWAGSGPVDESEQPLARHQFCRSARQPVRANGHEAIVADVEGLLAEASLRKPGPDGGGEVRRTSTSSTTTRVVPTDLSANVRHLSMASTAALLGDVDPTGLRRTDRLGGLIHKYRMVA